MLHMTVTKCHIIMYHTEEYRRLLWQPLVSRSLTMDFIFIFSFHFILVFFFFSFLFLEQLGLGFIGHAVTSVTS